MNVALERRARPRNRRGEGARLREEIIEAASELLAESGDVNQLTLRGVARRIGIAATSVYLHFADTRELAIAVIEQSFAALAAAQVTAIRDCPDPASALLARCRAYCHYGLANPGHYRVMFYADYAGALTYNAERSTPRLAFESLVDAITKCTDAGQAPSDSDPTQLGTLLWSAEHGLVSLRVSRPNFPWPPLDELIDEAVRRIVLGQQEPTIAVKTKQAVGNKRGREEGQAGLGPHQHEV